MIKELNHDVKFGIWRDSSCELLEEVVAKDEDEGEDAGTAGAVTLAVSVLIWRFTWRGK